MLCQVYDGIFFEGDTMKKSEYITFRLDEELKVQIQLKAQEKRWTISQTVAVMLEEYCKLEDFKKL